MVPAKIETNLLFETGIMRMRGQNASINLKPAAYLNLPV